MHCKAVRFGTYSDIVAVYSCRCGKEHFIYRGLNSEELKEFYSIIGEEKLFELKKKQSAAMAAEILCGNCGKKRRYIESDINRRGEFYHRFDCRNSGCRDFEKSVWMELTDEDCRRIEEKAAEAAKCRICGKIHGTKVHCPQSGMICEEHCLECKFHNQKLSSIRCVF